MSTNIMMPKLGMTMKEGTVEEWYVSEGDNISKGDVVASISSEKLTQDIEAPADGTLLKIKVQAGDDTGVKTVIGVIGEEGESIDDGDDDAPETNDTKDDKDEQDQSSSSDSNKDVEKSSDNENEEDEASNQKRIFISPLARKMAEKNDIDIKRVNGTGGNGRITKLDIERVLENGLDKDASAETASTASAQVPSADIGAGLNPMRKRIAQNMRQSQDQTAQLTLHRKVNADELIIFKDKLKKELGDASQDVKLSITALLAKAVVLALQNYKKMNVRYENGELTEYDQVNLGIATSLDDGLMVPVIENADGKSIGALAESIQTLSEKVRNNETDGVPMSGGTFTITNMGASEIEYFTPILNVGEAGILGVGAMQSEVVMQDGNVRQVQRIPFSLTFDHQILDGADAAEFLKILAKYIENPYLLVL
ncbi:dihydrolipoamide acetyltransferase family protein [Staphylococcus condimenti]|uniref:dihydrolipoamide acetyltransferase family protein n=1 Tax=Staphylococcus condimenti TaxID=70255 RepID=UPI001022F865|nr:dihydrolipoamide acetyltransferase family protein [Staphylococcus condimenti]RZI04180.1 2-oxo acid dehydrogenase subunit E2 [Staphylococcus condimenti]